MTADPHGGRLSDMSEAIECLELVMSQEDIQRAQAARPEEFAFYLDRIRRLIKIARGEFNASRRIIEEHVDEVQKMVPQNSRGRA